MVVPNGVSSTFHIPNSFSIMSSSVNSSQTINESLEKLKEFLSNAPNTFGPGEQMKRFTMSNGDSITCVLWKGVFHITGTDIVKILLFRFAGIGRQVLNVKKFEEGVFSDLRNLKSGLDATLEEPRSEFLEFLFKNGCIRTQKKQKVFYWYFVPHDRLFLDALERDLKRATTLINLNAVIGNGVYGAVPSFMNHGPNMLNFSLNAPIQPPMQYQPQRMIHPSHSTIPVETRNEKPVEQKPIVHDESPSLTSEFLNFGGLDETPFDFGDISNLTTFEFLNNSLDDLSDPCLNVNGKRKTGNVDPLMPLDCSPLKKQSFDFEDDIVCVDPGQILKNALSN